MIYGGPMAIELRNSELLPAPQGYTHASIADPGKIVHFAGQIGSFADGTLPDGLAGQVTQALANVVDALPAGDAGPEHLAKLVIYIVGWKESMQREFVSGLMAAGAKNPLPQVPITLIGVQSLYLDAALVEIEATAVVPA